MRLVAVVISILRVEALVSSSYKHASSRRATRRVSMALAPGAAQGCWLPVGSVSGLKGIGPQRVEICGEEFAVWEHADEWSVMRDVCPHRLAPLSQGRVDKETGCIECPYHGWQFDATGKACKVPQAEAGADISGLKGAYALATYVTGDLLWAFFDESSTGEKLPREIYPDERYPSVMAEAAKGAQYFTRELPYSFDFLIENFMDPAHIPFAHHGLQGMREDGSPIPMQVSVKNVTHVEATFQDIIRGQPRRGMTVSFERPCVYHFRQKNAETGVERIALQIYAVPIRDGRCRAIFTFTAPGRLKFPPWVSHVFSNRFLNTDLWLHYAERRARKGGDGAPKDPTKRYTLASTSDIAANVFRSWWADPKLGNMVNTPPNTFGAAHSDNLKPLSRAEQLDPWIGHSKTCSHCRTALTRAKKVKKAATVVGVSTLLLIFPQAGSAGKVLAKTVLVAMSAATALAAQKVASAIEGERDPSATADRSIATADSKPADDKK